MVIEIFTLRIQEAEAAKSQIPSQPGLDILPQKEKEKKEREKGKKGGREKR